ncbi:MAG TPA: hypothetical protein VI485_28635 [Vicinamibacterales bacterium]|nr:hypothetical protein [Vicinamibacterales bacterium]
MTRRLFATWLAALGVVLLITAGQAQTPGAPRTAWGDPDLEGIWTNATLTLLQRAPELGTKAFFTPEEAVAFEKQRVQQTNADRPLRAGEVGAYNDAFFERGTRGVKSRRTSLVIDPPDGRIPALTPEAQKKVDARQQEATLHPADRPEDRWLTERCILFGATVPMLPEPYNNNYQIIQTPGYVTIFVEMNHDVRVIPVDGRPALSQKVEQWTGSSRGRWEGNTLVVETANFKFNHQSRFGVQYLNGLSDENLRVVERFTRTDPGTLTYQARIEDPTVFTKPWTVEVSMDRTQGPLFEVACHEGNYGMFNILSGHRAEERAAAGRAR